MKKQRKLQSVKRNHSGIKIRIPTAKGSYVHRSKKGSGYNRNQEKKEFRNEMYSKAFKKVDEITENQ